MYARYYLLIAFIFLSISLQAQHIRFEEQSHDFGTIREEEGGVTHRFTFTNAGLVDVQIDTVLASCGCTSPEWSRQSIPPGEQGYVDILYDPLNRAGKFNKSLEVVFNKKAEKVLLKVSGFVSPYVENLEERYPVKNGDIRMAQKTLHLGKVTTKEAVTKVLEVYNEGDQILIFADTFQAPPHVRLEFHPETLWPKRRGEVHIIYDPKKKDDFGFVTDQLSFYTDEKENQEKSLSLMAVIFQYFPPQTPEMLAQAPRIGFNKMSYDFGNVDEEGTYKTSFQVTNFGRSPLEILRIKSNCECLSFQAEKQKLEAGENMNVEVTFDTQGRVGTEQKEIVIFSNDPRNPAKAFKVKAYVE
jgi:hypothetical protein